MLKRLESKSAKGQPNQDWMAKFESWATRAQEEIRRLNLEITSKNEALEKERHRNIDSLNHSDKEVCKLKVSLEEFQSKYSNLKQKFRQYQAHCKRKEEMYKVNIGTLSTREDDFRYTYDLKYLSSKG